MTATKVRWDIRNERRAMGRAAMVSCCLILQATFLECAYAQTGQLCDQYTTTKKLPANFEEIASAELAGGHELFVLTDGICTCDNEPDKREGIK